MNTSNKIYGIDEQGQKIDVLEELKNSLKSNGVYPQLTAGALAGQKVVTNNLNVTTVENNTTYINCNITGFASSGSIDACFINCTIGSLLTIPAGNIYLYACQIGFNVKISENSNVYISGNTDGNILIESQQSFKLYLSSAQILNVTGITSDNWRNVFVDGEASYVARNSSINITTVDWITVGDTSDTLEGDTYDVLFSITDNGVVCANDIPKGNTVIVYLYSISGDVCVAVVNVTPQGAVNVKLTTDSYPSVTKSVVYVKAKRRLK